MHSRKLAAELGISKAVLLILVAAIVPVALVVSAEVSIPFTAAVVASYLLQIGIFFFIALRWELTPSDPWVGLALLCGFAQLLTLASTTFQYGSFATMDLANAFSKVAGIMLYGGLLSAVIPTEREFHRLLKGILAITVLAIFVNVILNWSEFSQIFTVTSSYSLDFSSFFANRNQFGAFLFISIVVHCLYMYRRKVTLVTVLLFAAQVASLILTMSRGALLAFAVFWVAFCLLELRRRPKHLAILISIGIFVVLVGLYLGLDDLFNRLVLRSESGVTGRDTLWGAGLEVWAHSGVFFGAGTFSGLEIAQQQGMVHTEFHSFWVETLVSGGIAELCIMLIILGIAWRRLAKSSLDSYRRNLLYSAAIGFLVLSLVESISLFTIGLVGTMYSMFLVSVPLLYARLGDSCDGGVQPPDLFGNPKSFPKNVYRASP